MIDNMKAMLLKAEAEKYAVPQFNINNLEWTRFILEECERLKSPVILGVSEGAAKYMGGFQTVADMVKNLVEFLSITIPVAIHLDHGSSFENCIKAINAGFTSVMIDGSKYDFDENVRLTKQVVDYAHSKGVVVEAELGKLAGVEDDVNVSDDDARYTDPDQAYEFVQKTGCDSLAIAIGTSHGAYKFKGEARLRFDILAKVKEKLPNTPIVLHGASSVVPELVDMCNNNGGNIPGAKGCPDEMLKQAGENGVSKINVDTDLRLAMTAQIRRVFNEDPSIFDPRKYLGPARDEIKKTVSHKINNVFCSANKA